MSAGRGADKKFEDLRNFVRVPQRMRSGYLWHDKLIYPRPCMIKDVSVSGARVEIIGDPVKLSLLADGVKLYLETEKHEIMTSVRWAKGMQLGLRFEGRPRPPSRKYK
ncbi:PilZ domain-containing protein [Hyphomicrobium sp. LHD-15]|uniref:PilZ domain-containing protein n=1 Tax=Hyphomicrobium sp. LHD-15 TaxID=3072142 RepID=UPI00280C60AD|nr:PilZ domain-containing protein [Hyphomicrobium sp. LHD-15]MDQ8698374.1 PilZ domain-containing protein [Hyphomicrobium sp. LHD-15]